VTVQQQIVQLLLGLQQEFGLALVFIAHDLAVVRRLSHRVLVMYLGRVMETGPADALYRTPRHPYTRALLAAVPRADAAGRPSLPVPLAGEPPSPLAPPSGCVFRTRCPHAIARCAEELPALVTDDGGHAVACHLAGAPLSIPRVSS
jgi:oligopeptide transport system ATP-binding protein